MKIKLSTTKITILKFSFFLLMVISICCIISSQEKAAAKKAVRPSTERSASAAAYKPIRSVAPLKNPFLASGSGVKNIITDKAVIDPQPPVPILRGIVTHNNKQAGIFEYAGQSSYHTAGEKVGPYIIASFTDYSAILMNRQQQITVRLER